MLDPLLYTNTKCNIPVVVIQKVVTDIGKEPLSCLFIPDREPGARQREFVQMRQISMYFCNKYTKLTLARIAYVHGGRDHSTVLHAKKTVNNLLETKDEYTTYLCTETEKVLKKWRIANYRENQRRPTQQRIYLIKTWIRNRVPLYIRQKLLFNMNHLCSKCNQPIQIKK